MKRYSVAAFSAVVALVTVSAAFLWRSYRQAQPISVTGADVKNPLVYGNSEAAMKQTQELVAALQKADWDFLKVPKELMKLPDSALFEDPQMRHPDTMSFCFVPKDDPNIPEVGVYTDLYVRAHVKHYQGDTGGAKPEGFYIVGYRDGRVAKIPVSEVRLSRAVSGKRSYIFPDTKAYDKNLSAAWRVSER